MPSQRLDVTTRVAGLGGVAIGDFWSWAYSDILVNTNRGVFAEFLVASALRITDEPRVEWDAVDLRYRGKGIEVKASGYRQSWPQQKPSRIIFDVAMKRSWDAATNTYEDAARRTADCYVFCLLTEQDQAKAPASVLDVSSWQFYVVPTALIDRELGNQKSVGLARVQELSVPIPFGSIKDHIDRVLGSE